MSTPFEALAARVDALSRQVRANAELLAEVRQIAERADHAFVDLVDRVADAQQLAAAAVAATKARDGGTQTVASERRIKSWLAVPRSEALPVLVDWIERVLIHYPGTVDALSDCWPFHPWVVEELVALHAAWDEAFEGDRACGSKAVDWHDRLRKGVIARICTVTADCSMAAHVSGRRADHRLRVAIPGAPRVAAASVWWTGESRD